MLYTILLVLFSSWIFISLFYFQAVIAEEKKKKAKQQQQNFVSW